MQCIICSEDGGDSFVPAVLNCSHMFCLSCIITRILQFGPRGENNLSHPIANSNTCPLCSKSITSILPIGQLINETATEAYAFLKYFNDVIHGDLCGYDDDPVEILRQQSSIVSKRANELALNAYDAIPGSPDKEEKLTKLKDYIREHKLILLNSFEWDDDNLPTTTIPY